MGDQSNEMETNEMDQKMESLPSSISASTTPSRRSRSSKSTRSGSNSSGYGGEPSTNGSSTNSVLNNKTRKLKKKDHKKSKQIKIKSIVSETLKELEVANKDNIVSKEQVIESNLKENVPPSVMDSSTCVDASMEVHLAEKYTKSEDGFSCIISMHDGVVLYTTTSLTSLLGFPKDMWIGRSFISFLHPKDCNLFTSHILGFISPKIINGMTKKVHNQSNTMSTIFCRIRRYRGLNNSGFAIKDHKVLYSPFLLKFYFKNICGEDGSSVYLVVQAKPCVTAYKAPCEILSKATPFVIRHKADGKCEYLDPESVPYLGYLPQDIKDQCLLQLYHPDDLYYLAHVYQTIVKQGVAPRSKSFRILAHNGDYVRLETEWSSFINPWSSKLEFVIAKHYVVEGPANPDIFRPMESDKIITALDDYKIKSQFLKQNLVKIMNEVLTKPAEVAKQRLSKRCQDLAVFVEKLMEDPTNNQSNDDCEDVESSQDREIAGLIRLKSPRRMNSDSETDTNGTQLSYSRLNSTDILERYFESHRPYFKELLNNSFDLEDTCLPKSNMTSPKEGNLDLSGDSANGEFNESVSIKYEPLKEENLDLSDESANGEFNEPDSTKNEQSSISSDVPLEEILTYRPARLTENSLQRHDWQMRSVITQGLRGLTLPPEAMRLPHKTYLEDHAQALAAKRDSSHLEPQPGCSKQYKPAGEEPPEFVDYTELPTTSAGRGYLTSNFPPFDEIEGFDTIDFEQPLVTSQQAPSLPSSRSTETSVRNSPPNIRSRCDNNLTGNEAGSLRDPFPSSSSTETNVRTSLPSVRSRYYVNGNEARPFYHRSIHSSSYYQNHPIEYDHNSHYSDITGFCDNPECGYYECITRFQANLLAQSYDIPFVDDLPGRSSSQLYNMTDNFGNLRNNILSQNTQNNIFNNIIFRRNNNTELLRNDPPFDNTFFSSAFPQNIPDGDPNQVDIRSQNNIQQRNGAGNYTNNSFTQGHENESRDQLIMFTMNNSSSNEPTWSNQTQARPSSVLPRVQTPQTMPTNGGNSRTSQQAGARRNGHTTPAQTPRYINKSDAEMGNNNGGNNVNGGSFRSFSQGFTSSVMPTAHTNKRPQQCFTAIVKALTNTEVKSLAQGSASSGIAPSGIASAGIASAGIAPAGIAPAGIAPAGIAPSGIVSSGIAPSRIASPGIASAGIAPAGIAPSGIVSSSQQSFTALVKALTNTEIESIAQGIASSGIAPSGNASAGIAPAGIAPSGIVSSGIAPSRIASPGIASAGIAPAGIAPSGIVSSSQQSFTALVKALTNTEIESIAQGIASSGIAPSGIASAEIASAGIAPAGIAPSGTVSSPRRCFTAIVKALTNTEIKSLAQGIASSGIAPSGNASAGIASAGIASAGIAPSGIVSSSQQPFTAIVIPLTNTEIESLAQNIASAGIAPAGIAPAGIAPSGTLSSPQQRFTAIVKALTNTEIESLAQGIPSSGIAPSGNASTGIASAGIAPAGIAPAGIAPSGIVSSPQQSFTVIVKALTNAEIKSLAQGIASLGIALSGIASAGIASAGIAPAEIAPSGIVSSGSASSSSAPPAETDNGQSVQNSNNNIPSTNGTSTENNTGNNLTNSVNDMSSQTAVELATGNYNTVWEDNSNFSYGNNTKRIIRCYPGSRRNIPRAGTRTLKNYSTSDSSSTDSSSNDDINCNDIYNRSVIQYPKRKLEPPWMENISLTSSMLFNYRVNLRNTDVVLNHDRKQMNDVKQEVKLEESQGASGSGKADMIPRVNTTKPDIYIYSDSDSDSYSDTDFD